MSYDVKEKSTYCCSSVCSEPAEIRIAGSVVNYLFVDNVAFSILPVFRPRVGNHFEVVIDLIVKEFST
jgi:hypothetical protein